MPLSLAVSHAYAQPVNRGQKYQSINKKIQKKNYLKGKKAAFIFTYCKYFRYFKNADEIHYKPLGQYFHLVANNLAPVRPVFIGVNNGHIFIRALGVEDDRLLPIHVQGAIGLVGFEATVEYGDLPVTELVLADDKT